MNDAKKPRVVVFSIAYEPMIGGAEVALKELMTRMPEYEFSVIVAAHTFDIPAYEQKGHIHIYRVGRWCAFLGRLRNYVYIPLAVVKAYRLGNFELCWSVMAAYAGGAAYWLNRLTGVPVLLWLQEGDPLVRIERLTSWVSGFYRDFFSRVAYVQVLSEYLADIAKHFGVVAPVEVVPNGVDVARFAKPVEVSGLRERWTNRSDAIVIFPASRLEVKNGIDTIVRSLVFDERLVLVLAGDGSQRKMLEGLAGELGVSDRVVFLGGIAHEELPAYYQSADVFARPSRSEGMGISFIEAMAAGLPVVATTVGGIADFARDGENMLAVSVDDPKALAGAMVKACDDMEVRKRLIDGGKKTAARYDWDDIATRVRGIINTVIHE